MEENEEHKIHRNKPTTKSKVRSIRFDLDLVEYIYQQPNISKFINGLIRKEKERTEQIKIAEVNEILDNWDYTEGTFLDD